MRIPFQRNQEAIMNSLKLSERPSGQQSELKRALGLWDCILLVVGAIIGSGIFLTPSNIARITQSIGALFFVWLAGGILTFCGTLAYAELGTAYPKAGGIYVFLGEAYGRMTAFLFGWCVFFVMVTGSIATLASAFAIYLAYLVPISPFAAKIFAVFTILILSTINCLGVRSGALVQNLLAIIKIGSLIGIALVLAISSKGNLQHFSEPPAVFSATPWSALGLAMIAVLWAYDGWHLLTFTAGEVKNPKRNLTVGLLLGTLLVMCLYLLVNAAYLYILPFQAISGSTRVASDALECAIGPLGGNLVALAILISISGAINSNVLGGPRVLYAMARERLFFRRAGYIHPRYQVPTVAIILNGIWASFLTMVGSFERLFSYVIFVSWIFYAMGAAAVIILRHKQPEIDRPYKVWGYPWVPILFCLIAAAIVFNTIVNDFKNSFWGLLVVATGLPAYFYWSRKDRLD
jgi:APA family basic amino acid/polyamine antiporter